MKIFTSFRQLWLGQLPLHEAFWRYAITYDLMLNIAATLAALAFVLADTPIAFAAIVHFLPLPYSLFAATGSWRSADHYQGNPFHAAAAKFALIIWIGFWLIF
jgi:hypothetical protein